MAASDQDRNLPATPRKLAKARRDGQAVRSRDLGHFAAIAAGGTALTVLAPVMARWIERMVAQGLTFNAAAVKSPSFMVERLVELAFLMLCIVVPLGVMLMLVAVGVGVAAGGWVWTFKTIQPKLSKLNPISGVGRMFSKQQLIDALKASALALILGSIGAMYLRANVDTFGGVLAMPLPTALAQAGWAIVFGMALLLLALAAFALVDLPLQKYLHANRLKMSHQEMKQEHKETEGNAEVKAKLRARMREMSSRRMLAAIPDADLVVMNPTHYAVALKYDEAKMGAPRVVAKGADLLAMKIKEIATGAEVPVLQAPVLARALYAHAEIDREIPAALFSAVAQVLAYVYQLRAALAGGMPMAANLPELSVPPELDPHNKPGFAPDEVAT